MSTCGDMRAAMPTLTIISGKYNTGRVTELIRQSTRAGQAEYQGWSGRVPGLVRQSTRASQAEYLPGLVRQSNYANYCTDEIFISNVNRHKNSLTIIYMGLKMYCSK